MPSRAENSKPTPPPEATIITPPQIPPAAAKMPMGRVEAPAPPPVNIGNLAPKLDDVPQLLPWPSMNAKGAIKKAPVLDDASFWRTPARTVNVSGIPTVPNRTASTETKVPNQTASIDTKTDNKQVHPENGSAEEVSKEVLARFTADCKREVTRVWLEASHAVAELCANAKHAYVGWEVRKQIGLARQDAETRIAHLRINVSRQNNAAAAHKQKLSAAVSTVISRAQSAASDIQAKAAIGIGSSGQLARSLSSRRIRIRIAAGTKLTPLFQRIRQAQAGWQLALQRNSRLATSMTMAALSAVLALGLILVVSRYQPSASAGARIMMSPLPPSNSALQPVSVGQSESVSSAKGQSRPVPPQRLSSPKPSAVVNTALRAPTEPAQPGPVTTRRPHHNEDEDYVARDTYVYYGAKGKRSR